MGKLKPIGSEKLEGMAKINRMIEIAKYKENKPQALNENSSNEYGIKLADGMKYHIIKEKTGYVLKKGINESSLDYIEPMKNRKYYSSYSQALKRLNLITKEINNLEGNERNISLFTEGEEGEKQYFLKFKKETSEQAPPPAAPAPAPAPSPEPAPAPEAAVTSEPTSEVPDEEVPVAEPEIDTTDTEEAPDEEAVTFKTIQKLTGKLGQKLRTLNSDEENKMSSKDIKYVVNSILSALDLTNLDDEDRDQIMSKLEGTEEGTGEDMGMEDMSMGEPTDDMGGEEMSTEPPSPPSEEMAEYSSIDEYDTELDEYGHDMEEMYTNKMDEMIEGLFSESKVDKVLKKYFKLDEKEKRILKERKETKSIIEKVIRYSETVSQQVAARKFIKENKNVKFLGKTNQNNLIFERNNTQYKITTKGRII